MTETIPQSQRRYLQTALIETQRILIHILSRPKRKQSPDALARNRWLVAHWEGELERHDREYGEPLLAANPAYDENGRLRSERSFPFGETAGAPFVMILRATLAQANESKERNQ